MPAVPELAHPLDFLGWSLQIVYQAILLRLLNHSMSCTDHLIWKYRFLADSPMPLFIQMVH